jgi:penicillin-binding protein 1A
LNYGFETASQRYFDKSVFQLSKAQQIALITISKNPVRYDPYKHLDNFQTRYFALSKILLSGENISLATL